MRRLIPWLVAGPLTAGLVGNGCGSSGSGGTAQGGSGATDASVTGGTGGTGATGGSAGASTGGSGGGTGGSGGGTGGSGGSGGSTGGSSGTNTGGAAAWDGGFKYDASEPDAKLCVDETAIAEPVPLDIYFMLDASTSMSSPAGIGQAGDCSATPPFNPSVNSRWCKAVNAIAGYVSSPQAAGNQAAIQYFQVYSGHNCNGSANAIPSVPLGTLTGSYSGHAQTLVEQSPGGLNWAYPFSGTPTEAGLRGLAQFTAANKQPNRLIIGILVTDGQPGSCATSDTALRQIAQDHFNATGIHTFMVGMTGASFSRLETWASYTGALPHDDTNDACGTCNNCTCTHYNVGDGSPAVFIAALNAIQNAVLSCTFQMPVPTTGILNPDAVSVEYLPNGQPPPQQLPKVANAAACNGPGWYYQYDAQNKPISINLCPASCTTVQGDPNAEVNIRIACQGS